MEDGQYFAITSMEDLLDDLDMSQLRMYPLKADFVKRGACTASSEGIDGMTGREGSPGVRKTGECMEAEEGMLVDSTFVPIPQQQAPFPEQSHCTRESKLSQPPMKSEETDKVQQDLERVSRKRTGLQERGKEAHSELRSRKDKVPGFLARWCILFYTLKCYGFLSSKEE